MTKWFCRKCWRSGELLAEDKAEAVGQHLRQVNQAIRGDKEYAEFAGLPTMKISGSYCPGDVHLGEPPFKRERFKKDSMPSLNFGESQ